MDRSFPFSLRGRSGSVAVEYGVNEDPERWGYGILGLPWPPRLAGGLPVLRVTVSYPGEGYLAVMGWIQVVRIHVSELSESLVSDSERAPPGDHAWADVPPHLQGLGVPFVSFGPRPTLFDAPASTEIDIRFVADSFLTASPDALMSRLSRPFFGLRWGYSTRMREDPEVLPLTLLDVHHWGEALPILEEQFSDWHFNFEWFD
jgi:hypothetical protein